MLVRGGAERMVLARERLVVQGRQNDPEWHNFHPGRREKSDRVELAAVAVVVFVACALQSYLVLPGTLLGLRLFYRRTCVLLLRR